MSMVCFLFLFKKHFFAVASTAGGDRKWSDTQFGKKKLETELKF